MRSSVQIRYNIHYPPLVSNFYIAIRKQMAITKIIFTLLLVSNYKMFGKGIVNRGLCSRLDYFLLFSLSFPSFNTFFISFGLQNKRAKFFSVNVFLKFLLVPIQGLLKFETKSRMSQYDPKTWLIALTCSSYGRTADTIWADFEPQFRPNES